MKRKGIIVLFLSALILLSATGVLANTPHVVFNGQQVYVAAVIVDGRTLLPARDIVYLLGGTTDWDGELRQVTIQKDDTEIVLTIDNTTATVNGTPVRLDAVPRIINNRTKVPLAFVGTILGVDVSFSDGTVFIASMMPNETQLIIDVTPITYPTPETVIEPTYELEIILEHAPILTPTPTPTLITGPYIGNSRTNIFHRPDCDTLPAYGNRIQFYSAQSARDNGFRGCMRCRPWVIR